MTNLIPGSARRQTDHAVEPLFPDRWSPRAMSGAHIDKETMLTLCEAARWAPSSNNNQPWRFIYALRSSQAWPSFLDLLTANNQVWCKAAGALVVIVSKQTFDHNAKPSLTHSFDTGAAWMSLALQGNMLGLVVHGMQGFDYGKAAIAIGLPEGYSVEAMCALGYPTTPDALPEPLRTREVPSGRKALREIVFEGMFPQE